MLFTKLKEIPVSKSVISTFRGYNHNLRIGVGEFYDMENMTGDLYPLLSPRTPRTQVLQGQIQAMVSMDGLCYLQDGVLHYGNNQTAELALSAGIKQLIPFGAYIIIMPDKVWFNTADASFGSCEEAFRSDAPVGIVWSEADGTAIETVVDSNQAPENHAQVWLDTSIEPPVLKKYYETTGLWSEVKPTYLKVISDKIGESFESGCKVTLEGNETLVDIFGTGEHSILSKDRDFIVIEGSMAATRLELPKIQFELISKMPLMDFIFEHENRLWGCRYGSNHNGDFVNEIYASKLGDFKNWSSFQGVSTDSYIASCGTDGKWTGAIRAMGYPLFFKENYLHKVYGSYPAQYQIQTIACMGVQDGCGNSLAVVNGVLLYKARCGICVYDGSLPAITSEALGNISYCDAVAGSAGSKYYIAMLDAKQNRHLFCLDVQKGLWHREDDVPIRAFCTVGEHLLFLNDSGIWSVEAEQNSKQKVSWFAQTGIFGDDAPNHKYLSAITVRLSLTPGTTVRFLAQYDSRGSWHSLASITGKHLNSFSVPLRPQRCDHLHLRIEGQGEAKIYAITLTMEEGSDIR